MAQSFNQPPECRRPWFLRAAVCFAGLAAALFFAGNTRAVDGLRVTNATVGGTNNFPPDGLRARLALEPGHPVQTGQFAPGSELQEVKFSRPAKGRYFCLDAFSSHDGKPYAAVAELELLDEFSQPMSHEGWKIAHADSEEHEHEDGSAENAVDRDVTTCWCTPAGAAAPNFPHRLILDLGRSAVITGFRYLPRQGDPLATGRIKDYQISLADGFKTEALPVASLPEKCFLFSYFTGDGLDGLHLAWSLNGYQWEPLNHGQVFFQPEPGGTNLLRDPCLLRGPDGTFHLVWTSAWKGNSIGYASSKDLIHWSAQQSLPVMANEPTTQNCWAPEIYRDGQRQQFLIIWASAVGNRFRETLDKTEEPNNQRIYFTTTKDFKTFAPTKLFFDPGFGMIDPTLLFARGSYHLFFKDETSRPPMKNLRIATGDDLQGPFQLAGKAFSPEFVEGPAVFPVGDEYVSIFHFYNNNRWGALKSADLEHWTDVTERLNMPPNSHPGTVLEVPREILLSLWQEGRAEIGPAPETADLGVGHWIWTDTVEDKQTCRLWRAFEVPSGTLVSQATLRLTADNGYRIFLDGREIGRGGDINYLTEYDLTQLMTPGSHVLAVEGFNDALNAGVLLGLHLQMSSGQKLEILSDPSWFIVPGEEKNWEKRDQPRENWKPARIVGFAGKFAWLRPERIIASPPLLPQQTRFWQRGWFLFSLLTACALALVFSVRQGLKLAVQTRSQKLLERERDRIARDIHDDLGAGLTQLTLLGELVLRETPPGAATRSQLDSLCGKSRTLLGTMDELVWTVNSRRDTVQDFAAFVCEYAQEFLASTAIRCRLDVPEDLPPTPLDLPARRNLLLAVKEAVRNAARHSGASELSLQIRVADENLRVVLEDNGKGFAAPERTDRNGLRNMEERLADIGGVCRVLATPGQGCKVVFTLPLRSPTLAQNWLAGLAGKFWRKPDATDSHP